MKELKRAFDITGECYEIMLSSNNGLATVVRAVPALVFVNSHGEIVRVDKWQWMTAWLDDSGDENDVEESTPRYTNPAAALQDGVMHVTGNLTVLEAMPEPVR